MSGYFNSAAFTETLLAAMAGKPIDPNLLKTSLDEVDVNLSIPMDKTAQHGIWNTIVPDGLQLLIAQREKHVRDLQNKQKRESEQPENSGFVYVDVSESSSPASTQSSTSSLSQPPPSNLSTTSSSSFTSESSTDKAIKDALNMTMSRAPRAYRWASQPEKESEKYKAKRERNNEAVRRSREKNKFKKLLEDEKYDQLRTRYMTLLNGMKKCKCGCAAKLIAEQDES